MINSVSTLIEEFRKKEALILKGHKIDHTSMIGDIYEGLTRDIFSDIFNEELNLQIVEGKIEDSEGNFSKQIDFMIVKKVKEKIPYTDHYICDLKDVIAVIEIKKSLNKEELLNSYLNVNSMAKRLEYTNRSAMYKDAIENLLDPVLKSGYENLLYDGDKFKMEIQSIVDSILLDTILPVRIILGYFGFKKAETLKNNFTKIIEENEKQSNDGKFTPYLLPNLIISEGSNLVKLNGMPFSKHITQSFGWNLYGVSTFNPIYYILTLIFYRLNFDKWKKLFLEEYSELDFIKKIDYYITTKVDFKDVPNTKIWKYYIYDTKMKV